MNDFLSSVDDNKLSSLASFDSRAAFDTAEDQSIHPCQNPASTIGKGDEGVKGSVSHETTVSSVCQHVILWRF